jgi:hypothetical protein
VRTLFSLSILAAAAVLGFAAPAGASDPTAPQIELVHPAEGEGFYQGQRVQAAYGCLPGTLGSPVISCDGDLPLGELLDTSSVGTHTFTVRAVDYAGQEMSLTHTYTVFDVIPPTTTIATPAAGAEYRVGAELYASFSCDDGPGGSAIVGCVGTYPNGYPLPTDRPGTFSFSVDAFDAALNHGTATATYRVVDRTPPQITISSPADGASYWVGEVITPSYFCHDDTDGSLVSCKATPIDASPGTHVFRVDSVDSAGNAAFASSRYSVRYAFDGFYSPLVAEPASASARAGDMVPVKFSLDGDRGLDVLGRAAWRPCSSTSGDSSTASGALTYNPGPGRYTFMWQTDKSWAGACRELSLTLRDGTAHAALVSFR